MHVVLAQEKKYKIECADNQTKFATYVRLTPITDQDCNKWFHRQADSALPLIVNVTRLMGGEGVEGSLVLRVPENW